MARIRNGLGIAITLIFVLLVGGIWCLFLTNMPTISYAAENVQKTIVPDAGKELNHKPDEANKSSPLTQTGNVSQAPPTEDNLHSKDYIDHLEFYINQITQFYFLVITLLLAIITILLVVGFLFIRFTTKKEIEDGISEALNSTLIQSLLKSQVERTVAETTNNIEVSVDDLVTRVGVLEKMVTTADYKIEGEGEQ